MKLEKKVYSLNISPTEVKTLLLQNTNSKNKFLFLLPYDPKGNKNIICHLGVSNFWLYKRNLYPFRNTLKPYFSGSIEEKNAGSLITISPYLNFYFFLISSILEKFLPISILITTLFTVIQIYLESSTKFNFLELIVILLSFSLTLIVISWVQKKMILQRDEERLVIQQFIEDLFNSHKIQNKQ